MRSSFKHGNPLFLLMAATLSLFLFSLLFSGPFHVSSSRSLPSTSTDQVQACKATMFPDTCLSSLSSYRQTSDAVEIIQSAAGVSLTNLKTAQKMVQSILMGSSGNINRSSAATNCVELLDNSYNRAVLAVDRRRLLTNSKDSLAWFSAALLYQYDCWSALKYVNDTSLTNQTMSFLSSLITLSSNALAMVRSLDAFGTDVSTWSPPKTERDGFWPQSRSTPSFTGVVPPNLTPDVTVCKAGCNYKAVQEAVNAAPKNIISRKFVIWIKEGVYDEIVRVPVQKTNLVFLGDGIGRTVITGSLNAGLPGVSTYNTATVAVLGDGFMARDLTIQNTAGPPTYQAVAFRSDSDLSVMEKCEFLGNQDTLYAHSLRQFYKSCRIVGNVDFIFGNSASVFDDCLIQINPRQLKPEKGENNAVTAHGRTDPSQSTGFVFRNCIVNGTDEYMTLFKSKPEVHRNYLGRPWKEYSRTVFIGCTLASIVSPPGWLPWSGDFALKTLYYGEYGNSGPGSDTSNRVSWSSLIPPEHVVFYSPTNFIEGDRWIPSVDLK